MEERADLVIVGGGAIGGWASYFARRLGAEKVIVLESGHVGDGASSRAAGMVRAQGGTPNTVRLGAWSIDFYRRQQRELPADSGFRQLGYLILARTGEEETTARERIAMQRSTGVEVRWVDAAEAALLDSWLSPSSIRGASYAPGDGCIDPVRNVRAYSLAMQSSGVELRESCAFAGIETARTDGGLRLTGVLTDRGAIAASRLVLTGGPQLRDVGRLAGLSIPAGAVRHQVAVTEPHQDLQVKRRAMGFDLEGGLYWRLEDGGLLFGMSNPSEPPGIARSVDWDYLALLRKRLGHFLPMTQLLELRKVWAATIDFTPDHQPILGPAIQPDGTLVEGVTVASAGGHGMMWGPAVAKIAADLALTGKTEVADVSQWGLDRFDAQGRSRIATDPIALPFPTSSLASSPPPPGDGRVGASVR